MPKLTYRLNTIPVKISSGHFVDIGFKIYIERQRIRISKMALKHMNNVVGIPPPNFATYYEATGIKTVWNCRRSHTDQWSRMDSQHRSTNRAN